MKQTFAELWDVVTERFLYDTDAHVDELEELFGDIGIDKDSKILDTCAGTGFPALHLRERGYNVDCMDSSEDMRRMFRLKAAEKGVLKHVENMPWKKLPFRLQPGSYDLLLCRGNSFIYAAGGWMSDQEHSKEKSMIAYKETLRKFESMLIPEGFLYIDKWKDSEQEGKHKIGPNEYFEVSRPKPEIRKVKLIVDNPGEKKLVFPNTAYALSEPELEKLVLNAGFRSCEKIDIPSEHYFVTYLAQKR